MSAVIKAISRSVRLTCLITMGLLGVVTFPANESLAAPPTQTSPTSTVSGKRILI
ncbi:MAG: hypothetical protein HQK58_11525, partial [Deltaproteobacteria bacterium]|nr:hypothetical protein [Deltaproteobacteria bacterium]